MLCLNLKIVKTLFCNFLFCFSWTPGQCEEPVEAFLTACCQRREWKILTAYIQAVRISLVRPIGLEPTRRKTLDPKSSASTNFATGARAVAKVMNNILFLLVWSRFFAFQRNILHVQVLILWRSWLCVLIAMAEFVLQSFVAIHSKNREATILEGFGQSKEHHPQRCLLYTSPSPRD